MINNVWMAKQIILIVAVQYPNWWYLRRVKDNNLIFSDWAILFIDPMVATIETTQFCKACPLVM